MFYFHTYSFCVVQVLFNEIIYFWISEIKFLFTFTFDSHLPKTFLLGFLYFVCFLIRAASL